MKQKQLHIQTANKLQSKTNNNDRIMINNDNKEIRQTNFINKTCSEGIKIIPMVDPDIINAFNDYWTESNTGGNKMRFEKQKTFDTKRRLKRWIDNQKEWKPITKHKNEDFKFDSSGYNRVAYCEKCNESDFYKYPASEDSRCCGEKLIPKRK